MGAAEGWLRGILAREGMESVMPDDGGGTVAGTWSWYVLR
jgi:hypothetical protein